MGGAEAEGKPLKRFLWYEGVTHPEVVEGVLEGRGGEGSGSVNGGIDGGGYGDSGGDRGDEDGNDVDVSLKECDDSGTGGHPGGEAVGGGHVAVSGTDTQGGRGIHRHRPSGGDVEGGDSDS